MFEWLLKLFGKKPKKRLYLRQVSWLAAEELLAKGWTLAKEEDTNKVLGTVFLELLDKE